MIDASLDIYDFIFALVEQRTNILASGLINARCDDGRCYSQCLDPHG